MRAAQTITKKGSSYYNYNKLNHTAWDCKYHMVLILLDIQYADPDFRDNIQCHTLTHYFKRILNPIMPHLPQD